jgi:hypothetical protein
VEVRFVGFEPALDGIPSLRLEFPAYPQFRAFYEEHRFGWRRGWRRLRGVLFIRPQRLPLIEFAPPGTLPTESHETTVVLAPCEPPPFWHE